MLPVISLPTGVRLRSPMTMRSAEFAFAVLRIASAADRPSVDWIISCSKRASAISVSMASSSWAFAKLGWD